VSSKQSMDAHQSGHEVVSMLNAMEKLDFWIGIQRRLSDFESKGLTGEFCARVKELIYEWGCVPTVVFGDCFNVSHMIIENNLLSFLVDFRERTIRYMDRTCAVAATFKAIEELRRRQPAP